LTDAASHNKGVPRLNLPPPPNVHALAVLVLTVVSLILFTREKIPLESSSFLVLISLAVGFEVFPFPLDGGVLHAVDFFRGFGHEALVAVCALMIAGQGIVRTGALEPVGRVLTRLWKASPGISLLLTLVAGAFISAFINNVPVVVLFLPILISVSLRTGMKASSVLMPMGFPSLVLKAGDHLIIRDTPERLKEFEKILEGTLYADDAMIAPVDEEHPLEDKDQQIGEIILIEGSRLVGRAVRGIGFADRFGIIVLAIHRAGRHPEKLKGEIGDIRLMAGDILLVQGPREKIAGLKKENDFLVIDATADLPFARKAPVALLIMLGIIVSAAVGFLPIAISAPLGALLMILTGCLGWRDATRALNAQVILIVAASLAIGVALLKTGGADYLAQLFVALAGDTSPVFVISGLMLLMAILTNIVSNNAAAVIGTPIAISIAAQMGQPAEPFVLAVLFGANMSYATPMAYKTNLLVMNAGNYTFNDFLRIGVPLLLIMWVTLSFLLPILYGIQ
jgi:di/tricarboxylate transporter